MWVYVILLGVNYTNSGGALGISAAATVMSLALLGCMQGMITKQDRLKSATLMVLNGSFACACAYGIAAGIKEAIPKDLQC